MLSALRTQMRGRAAERVAAQAAFSAERLMRKLLTESIIHWAAEGFHRYDDGEISCTARMCFWCQKVIDANRGEMISMHIQYDGPLPTRAMLLGLEDPSRSPRPDLTVRCGTASIHVEAKRLIPTGELPKKYVNEGMMRFIDGRYVSPGHSLAQMLGYVMAGSPLDAYEAVNEVIRDDKRLGAEHVAKEREPPAEILDLYESEHGFGRILHYAIDLRSRNAPTVASAYGPQSAVN